MTIRPYKCESGIGNIRASVSLMAVCWGRAEMMNWEQGVMTSASNFWSLGALDGILLGSCNNIQKWKWGQK